MGLQSIGDFLCKITDVNLGTNFSILHHFLDGGFLIDSFYKTIKRYRMAIVLLSREQDCQKKIITPTPSKTTSYLC